MEFICPKEKYKGSIRAVTNWAPLLSPPPSPVYRSMLASFTWYGVVRYSVGQTPHLLPEVLQLAGGDTPPVLQVPGCI